MQANIASRVAPAAADPYAAFHMVSCIRIWHVQRNTNWLPHVQLAKSGLYTPSAADASLLIDAQVRILDRTAGSSVAYSCCATVATAVAGG